MEELGNKIKMLREQQGMTLEELGSKVGVGKSTIRKWEVGMIANMRRDNLQKLANALGVNPNYLMGYNEESQPSYYIDDDVRELAQFLHDSPEYKVLFDASRRVKKEDIDFVKRMIDKFGDDN